VELMERSGVALLVADESVPVRGRGRLES